MNQLKVILAALSMCLCINVFAAESKDDEHMQVVKRMLLDLRIVETTLDGVKSKLMDATCTNPALTDDTEWVIAQLTLEGAVDRLMPIYAEYLSSSQAKELRSFFNSPPGNKIWPTMLDKQIAGKVSFLPPLKRAESRKIDAFLAENSSWRVLEGSKKEIAGKVDQTFYLWSEQILKRRYAGSTQPVVNELEVGASGSGADIGKGAPPESLYAATQRLGNTFLTLVQELNNQRSKIVNQLTARVKEIDIATVLAPVTLMSREGIEDGRHKLSLYEGEFSKSQRELNRLNDEFIAELHKLTGPPATLDQLIRKAEEGIAISYERSLRAEENQRRILAIMGQFLNFADERFGHFRLQDSQLIFTSDADLRRYELLRQQLEAEAKTEAEITQEQLGAREKSIKKQQDVTAVSDASSMKPSEELAQRAPSMPVVDERKPVDSKPKESMH